MRLKLSLLTILFVFSCASHQTAYGDIKYRKGSRLPDKIEIGAITRVEYKLSVAKTFGKYCYLQIERKEYRKKLVTPLYEEVQVIRRWVYDPKPNELIADIIGAPLNILSGNWAGNHVDTQKIPTGRAIKGRTQVRGEVEVRCKTPPEALRSLTVNKEGFRVILDKGFVKIPLKLIADEYLMKGRVEIRLTENRKRFGIELSKDYLEEVLKGV